MLPFSAGGISVELQEIGLELNGNISANFFVKFDTANEDSPFANKLVREAVEYAIDREAIAEGYSYGFWDAPYQIAPQDSGEAYDPDYAGRRYDPDYAQQLLAEAGYPDGFTCTMLVTEQSFDLEIPVAVQGFLADIGITVNLDYPGLAKYFSMIMEPLEPGTLLFEGSGPQGVSRNNSFAFAYNPYNTYYVSWEKSPEFIALYDATMSSPTEDIELVKAVLHYMQDECLLAPVSAGGKGWAEQPYVMDAGWNTRSLISWWTFEKCWLDK